MFVILTDALNGMDMLIRTDAITVVRDTKKAQGLPLEPFDPYGEPPPTGTEVRLLDGDRVYVKQTVGEVQALMGITQVAHPGDLAA